MKFLLPLLLLTGCICIFLDHTAPYPVELPGNIAGIYVQCGNDLECQRNCVGVCTNGYWVAEEMTALEFPHNKIGEVIVCGKAPSQQ